MEIFTNWLNNLVAKPSFHSLIKKDTYNKRVSFNECENNLRPCSWICIFADTFGLY